MVPCTDAAQDLATLVLSRASSALAVCLFQRCFLLYPTMCFALHRKLWTGRILPPIQPVRAVLQGGVPPGHTGSDTGE